MADYGGAEAGLTEGASCTSGENEYQVLIASDRLDEDVFEDANRSFLECDVPHLSKSYWVAGADWIVGVTLAEEGPEAERQAAEDAIDKMGSGSVDSVSCPTSD